MTESDELGPLTPADMAQWLRQETQGISRASELRIQEATDFVTAYLTGNLSQQQMEKRFSLYKNRWGDPPLLGIDLDGTNEDILRRLDKANAADESWEHPITHQRKIRPHSRGGNKR